MTRVGAVKLGCLIWIVLILIVILWGWKLLDFYVLGPAAVKKVMNETWGEVNSFGQTQVKQAEYLMRWNQWKREQPIPFVYSGFSGDSFVVEWSDTLPVPVFPDITHKFRLARIVR
jgi:hypothetical protein